jgi:hypothetical protein
MEHEMKQLSALDWGQASLGWLPALCIEPCGCECLEGALGLGSEDSGAAMEMARPIGNSREIVLEFGDGICGGLGDKISWQGHGLTGNVDD